MKKFNVLIIIVLFLLGLTIKAQTTNVIFTYDAAGNMIQRQVTVIPPPPPCPTCPKLSSNPPKDSAEVQPPINFKIYPNPAQTYVTIEGILPKDCNEAKVQLINNTGQLLKTDTYTGDNKTIDVSNLKNGIYLLEIIYSKKQKSTYKIVVTN